MSASCACLQFALRRGQFAVANLGDFRKFAGTLHALLFGFELVNFAFDFADAANGFFLDLPLSLEPVGFFAQRRQLFFDFL